MAYESPSEKRQPITTSQIKRLQEQCYLIDDDVRWLVALISDTGMRLAEAAGLKRDDLNLEHQYPHITLKPYVHRSLKTKASERIIPLVGVSLWAAKRTLQKLRVTFVSLDIPTIATATATLLMQP